MNLYTDDNPQTTLKGLGFKNKLKALQTIIRVESYFDKMYKSQVVPGWTPYNVLPRTYIETDQEAFKYYQKQKMYRILGMHNRAKGMINRIKDKEKKSDMFQAMIVFKKWMTQYKSVQLGGNYPYCCEDIVGYDYCYRKSDNKKFKLPRKYNLEKCKQGVNGFTMRSSCAPFNDCLN